MRMPLRYQRTDGRAAAARGERTREPGALADDTASAQTGGQAEASAQAGEPGGAQMGGPGDEKAHTGKSGGGQRRRRESGRP